MQHDHAQFIFMRTDLKSMNPGKAMAQAAHAANALNTRVNKLLLQSDIFEKYMQWEKQTEQGFGTCIVLDGGNLDNGFNSFAENEYIYEEVFDPTYPIRDGKIVHHIPLITCGIMFGEYEYLRQGILKNFKLYK